MNWSKINLNSEVNFMDHAARYKTGNSICDEGVRSPAVNEILEGNPGLLVNNGIQILICIIVALALILGLVQVEETVPASITMKRGNIQNSNPFGERKMLVEIMLASRYQDDLEAGKNIIIQFTGDAGSKNNNITTAIDEISYASLLHTVVIKANVPVRILPGRHMVLTHLNNSEKIEVRFRVALVQHLYRNMFLNNF